MMSLPSKGVAYEFFTALVDSSDGMKFKVNPTIAEGDFQISKDGGNFVNLTTLPVVEPAGSIGVKISLSSTEMTADKIQIKAEDQAGDEWNDLFIFVDVPLGTEDNILAIVEEVWRRHGLDVANPMTVTPTSIVAGSISQTISGDGESSTTVTRN